jgi:MFS family permease
MSSESQVKPQAYHWILFTVCLVGTAFAGIISTLMSVYLPVVVRELLGYKTDTELNNISAYINSVFILGGSLGGFITGIISDKAGRKPAVILSILFYSVSAILTGFMKTWEAVVICRAFSGFGLGGIIVAGTTLMVEEWPSKTKAIFIGILSIAIPVGIFSAGVIDLVAGSWRQGFLVGILPLAIGILSIWILRESGKWKMDRERIKPQAQNSSQKITRQYSLDLFRGSLIFGTMLIGIWAFLSWVPTWIQELMPGQDTQQERGISMMLLGGGGLIGGFFSGWLLNRIGARKSLLIFFIVSILLSFLLFRTNHEMSTMLYIEILVIALVFGASQGVLSVYIPNLFPVTIRGTATGICFNTGRLCTAAAVLFVGVLVDDLGGYGNSLMIFSLVFVIGLIITYYSRTNKISEN